MKKKQLKKIQRFKNAKEKTSSGFSALGVVAVIAAFLIVAGVVGYLYFFQPSSRDTSEIVGRPCSSLEDQACTRDIRIMCNSDSDQRKNVSSNCSCGEDARSLEAEGWTACPSDEAAALDTSDWKTYRNEEYGFEVRYPEGWQVGSDGRGASDEISTVLFFQKAKSKVQAEISQFR